MGLIPAKFRAIAKRSDALVSLNKYLNWKFHLFIDLLGTKIWTRTSEVMTPYGFKLISGLHPAYKLMRAGQFEIVETEILLKLFPGIDVFIDIGANLGYYTCLALKCKKQVLAFEPQQQNLECLYRNLSVNGWQDLAEIFPLALSENHGLLTLYGASGPSASLVKNWAGYSPVFKKYIAVSTLDKILLGRFKGARLLIKIDVEGAEFDVLKGSIEVLSFEPKPIWLVEICLGEFHPAGQNPDFLKIFNLFWDYGYQAYTATSTPKLVTREEVMKWLERNYSSYKTFNYVFSEISISDLT